MFDTSGLDELIRDMRRLGEYSGAAADAMVLAAADEIRKAWKETAEKKRIKKTGEMIKSIGYSHEVRDIGGVKYTDVYPQGKDPKKGIRNATKAFILYHGSRRWKNPKGRTYRWADEANAKAEPQVTERLTKMWEQYLKTGRAPV